MSISLISSKIKKQISYLESEIQKDQPNDLNIKLFASRIFILNNLLLNKCGIKYFELVRSQNKNTIPLELSKALVKGKEYYYQSFQDELHWYICENGQIKKIDYNPLKED